MRHNIRSAFRFAPAALVALIVGSAAVLPQVALAATAEQACKDAIAAKTAGDIGDPVVTVGDDGVTTVQTMVSGQTITCTASADGEVLSVNELGAGN
ncbi:MAG: hypothetical protein KDA73_02625 [Rhodobacteraceae bacterium]|nr:hypothetical protein [Paracoccaceae bacterium]